ncbi:hypothetical protein I203_100280 [Kwoniella mangroviensis CBS 8507]|uniref:uncharacterized protein n=1 Tax=Kwoniella mangroviensis CBS 8507 TaxID=1296122 RepID=UPI00080D2081|nr:uncharacterized protein I203_05847 [Kwoniella mangroviensis CBS 8507]OCF65105.1 hypothetical protein I203_05847 [Kwoniella mangroviensis CBS 8507]
MSSIFPQRPTTHYRRISSAENANTNRNGNGKTSSPTRQSRHSHSKSPLSPLRSQSHTHGYHHHAPSITSHSPKPHSLPPLRHSTTPLSLSSPLTRPPITPRANSMMYNNPYQWGGQSANGMMSGGYNPYMMPGSTMNGFTPSNAGGGGAMPAQSGMTDGGLKPFDSSKMKQGRMGHYGYLEGRELAGPPVGFLPAGVQPEQYHSSSPSAHGQGQISPSHRAASTARQSYYTAPAPSGGGSVNGSMAWGDMGNTPRARYDGSSSAAGYVQADLDTPYPRTSGGGASSAFTRYGPDGSVVNGIDGRMGINHRRLREGRV